MALMLVANIAYTDSAVLESQDQIGRNRLCSYNYIGGPYIMTIRAYLLCPATIDKNMLAALTISPAHPDHPANKKP
jgi:hypothetical protein